MTTLPLFPEHETSGDDTPLPLLVAKKWGFPLAFHIVEGTYLYAIQDWVRGLTGTEDIRLLWGQFKRQEQWQKMSNTVRRVPYIASDGKTYKREFTTAENLILIVQYLRDLESRPILRNVRIFLNRVLALQSGILPQEISKVSNFEPPQASDDLPLPLSHNGKTSDNHPHLLDSFVGRTQDTIKKHYYDLVTNDIYLGLWKRTPEQLKLQLGSRSASLNKNHMSPMARSFHEMVCEMVKMRLADRQDLWWWEIRQGVREATTLARSMINQAEVFLQIDLATGRPLLPHS